MATSMLPMLEAIEEVCCDGAGLARTIGSGDRFRRGPYPDQPRSEQGTEAMVQKGMYASVERAIPRAQPEMHDILSYDLSVRLDLFYHLAAPRVHSAMTAALAEAAIDMHRLRMALGYPGNIQTNSGGEATGLSGAALQFQDWSMSDPDSEARLIRANMSLIGRINLTA